MRCRLHFSTELTCHSLSFQKNDLSLFSEWNELLTCDLYAAVPINLSLPAKYEVWTQKPYSSWKTLKSMIPKLKLSTNTQIHNAVFSRFYYTNRINKTTLYSIISPLGNPGTRIEPELDNWVKNGNKVRVGELQRIIRDLRKRKRFSQALEVWILL